MHTHPAEGADVSTTQTTSCPLGMAPSVFRGRKLLFGKCNLLKDAVSMWTLLYFLSSPTVKALKSSIAVMPYSTASFTTLC